MKIVVYISLITLSFMSCKKAEDRKCWKGAGDSESIEIVLNAIDTLELGGRMQFNLISDTVNKAVVNGYLNLNNFIFVIQDGGKVDITNENNCNYFRSFKKKIVVDIHYTDLNTLIFKGSEPLVMENQLVTSNFNYEVYDGAGPVSLNVSCNKLKAVLVNGHGDLTLLGNCNYAYLRAQGVTAINSENFYCVDSVLVSSNSTADLFVNATTNKFKTDIFNRGDIYYKGTPGQIQLNNEGEGQLLNNN